MKNALCNGTNTDIFFEDRWADKRIPFTKGLEKARTFCDACPVRRECLAAEMEYEKGMLWTHRAGIYGGLTPAQRFSLEKRGTDYSEADPVELRRSIPDRGDQWEERHTALARDIITWLVEHTPEGLEVPSAAKLSRILGSRVNDVRRVYQALQEDQIIVRTEGGALIRRAHAASARKYLPPHLRPC